MPSLDLAVVGGVVVDGTGAAGRLADVGIAGGLIVAVGDLQGVPAARVIDAADLVVAPGFIDIHQHGDVTPLVDGRCVSAIGQGVTTIVVGNCGHGVAPGAAARDRAGAIIGYREGWGIDLAWPTFAAYLDSLALAKPGVNIAALAGHGALRLAAMGPAPRAATEAELARMESMLDEAMRAGALGMSSGLEYAPGMYADTAELQRLNRIVGRHGGTYASHIRNRGDAFVAAVAEAIAIARSGGTRLVLSHLAPRPYAPPDAVAQVRQLIEEARADGLVVTIDTFPDSFGPSPLASLMPPWILEGSPTTVLGRLADPEVLAGTRVAFEQRDNFLLRVDGPANLRLSSSVAHRAQVGRMLEEVAADWGVPVADAVTRLLRDEGVDFYSVLIQHRYATQSALDDLYADPACAFESDGVVAALDGPLRDLTMNRSTYGYTARVLAELVRERRSLSLEEAVRRMTSLPAAAVGLDDRGEVRPGANADLVVFDPVRVADRTSDVELAALPAGIEAVIVGGRAALQRGRITDERAGRVLRRLPDQRTARSAEAAVGYQA